VPAFPSLSFSTLTVVTHAGDGSNRVFAVQKAGQIRVFANNPATTTASTFLDLSSKLDASGEGGALGLAFDPDYSSNGYFYVTYTLLSPNRKVRLSRFRVGANANTADPNSERVVYEYDHMQTNHFGSWIGFGPDRLLYLSTGDNGRDQLQSTASPYGKVLRMRINADGSYSVPTDNPWGNLGYAMGFRNPWRCSFDRVGGALWCGDVGENTLEEVNVVRRGAHYGWDYYEGNVPGPAPTTQPYSNFAPALHQYPRSEGASVTGGYVYRGSALPGLVGRYVYGDFVSWRVWAVTLNASGQFAGVTQVASNVGGITTFGEDQAGELFAGTVDGRLFRFEAQ
jgi:glucose/arabinose dehydrogenase